jgi:hypothetical protein
VDKSGRALGPSTPTQGEEGNDAEAAEEEGTPGKRSGISANEDEDMPANQATAPPESLPPPSLAPCNAEVPDFPGNAEPDGEGENMKLLFGDVRATEYWVERGRTACEELTLGGGD